jgi:hypothetical protein
MEQSKSWTKITTLGKRIALQLDLEDDNDLLAHWMSHRIAELIAAGEHEGPNREQIKRECTDLILRVWEHRSHWPKGWPPPAAAELLQALDDSHPATRRRRIPKMTSWLDGLSKLRKLHDREDSVWRKASIASLDIQQELMWLTNDPDSLSEDQKNTLQTLSSMYENLNTPYTSLDQTTTPNFASLPDSERTKLTIKVLQKIDDEKSAILKAIIQTTQPATKRNPKKKNSK